MFAKSVGNHFNIPEIWSAMLKPNILMSKKYFVIAVEKVLGMSMPYKSMFK